MSSMKKRKHTPKETVDIQNKSINQEYDDWEKLLYEAELNTKCSCCVSLLVESDVQQIIYTNLFHEAVQDGLRKSIKVISKNEMMKMLSKVENLKSEPNPCKYIEVCEKGFKIIEEGGDISTELWVLLIKFQILTLMEDFVLQKIREDKYKFEKDIPELKEMIPEVKQKGKRGKESVKSKKGKSPVKKTDLQKPDSKIRQKGDEWKDIPFIDDAPMDGPEIYIFIIGFHDPHLPTELVAAGIPLLCFVKLFTQLSMKENKNQPILSYSKSLTDLRKSGTEKSKKFKTQTADTEETAILEIAINEFWREVNKIGMNINEFAYFRNVPIVPYELPDLPSDMQNNSQISKIMYEQLSFLLYDIHGLKKQHSNYLSKMKVWLENVNDSINNVKMTKYKTLIDRVPTEFAFVPIIMECMLEQVVDTCENHENSAQLSTIANPIEEKDPISIMKDKLHALSLEYGIIGLPKAKINFENPYVISFGDDILMNTFNYKGRQIDFASVTYELLKYNPISLLWSKFPPLHECEKILYAYHTKKLMEFINNDDLDYSVVFYILCLLKFEDMLHDVSKSSSFFSPAIPTHVVTAGCGSQFITLQQMENIKSLSEELGCKSFHLNVKLSKDFVIGTLRKVSLVNKNNIGTKLKRESHVNFLKSIREKNNSNRKNGVNPTAVDGKDNVAITNSSINSDGRFKFKRDLSFKESSVNPLFYCQEIINLFIHKNVHDLFKFTKYYGYVEQLNEQVLAQVIYSIFNSYSKFDCVYFTPCDVLLVLFYNPHSVEKVVQDCWSAKLSSPVAFRDFYEYVLYEEIDWLEKENKNFNEVIMKSERKEKSDEDNALLLQVLPKIAEENVFGATYTVEETEYILERSLKYEDMLKLQGPEITEAAKKDTKNTVLIKGMTNVKILREENKISAEANSNITEILKERESSRIRESVDEQSPSTNKVLLREGKRERSSSKKQILEPLEIYQDDDQNRPQGYDLGIDRIQFFGKDTKFISSNGNTTISVKFVDQFREEKLIALAIEQKNNSLFYYVKLPQDNEKIYSKQIDRKHAENHLPLFHLVLKGGVVVVFSQKEKTDKDLGDDKDASKLKEREKGTGKEIKKINPRANKRRSVNLTSPDEEFSDSSRVINKIISAASISPKPIEKEKKKNIRKEKEEHQNLLFNPGFDFKLSLPSGLTVEKKNSTGSLGPFYIKQKYISKGLTCVAVNDEECRLYLQNGNVLKFMSNGEVIILHSNGTIYICKKFEVKHFSEEITAKEDTEKFEDDAKELYGMSVIDYTVILPSGKVYEKKNGKINELPPYIFQYATDLEANEIFMHRGDGTNSLLKGDSTLVVNFPDKSCISTSIHVVEDDFLADVVWEMEDFFLYETKLEITKTSDNNEEIYPLRKDLVGKQVVEESYVTVHINFHLEHPHYAAVYFEGYNLQGKVKIPQNIFIDIMPEGTYIMNIDDVKIDITTSFAKLSQENSESVLYFPESKRGDINIFPDNEEVCVTNDGCGNIFTVKADGTTTMSRSVGRDSHEMRATSKMRLFVIRRDNSGAEFHKKKTIEDELKVAKSKTDMSVVQYPESSPDKNSDQFSPFYTIFTPLSESEKYNWHMAVENIINAIKLTRKDIVRSTYGIRCSIDQMDKYKPTPAWFHPFSRFISKNERKQLQKLTFCEQCFPKTFKDDASSLPEALCLRVFRQLGSLGLPQGGYSLAQVLLQAFHRYKISSDQLESLHLYNDTDILGKCHPLSESLIKYEMGMKNEKSWFINVNDCSWELDAKEAYFHGLQSEVLPRPSPRSSNHQEFLRRLESITKSKEKEKQDRLNLRDDVILPYFLSPNGIDFQKNVCNT